MDREMREIYQQLAAVKAAMLAIAMMSFGGVFIFSYLMVACLQEGKGGLAITAVALAAGLTVVMKGSIDMYQMNMKIMRCILKEDYQAAKALMDSLKK